MAEQQQNFRAAEEEQQRLTQQDKNIRSKHYQAQVRRKHLIKVVRGNFNKVGGMDGQFTCDMQWSFRKWKAVSCTTTGAPFDKEASASKQERSYNYWGQQTVYSLVIRFGFVVHNTWNHWLKVLTSTFHFYLGYAPIKDVASNFWNNRIHKTTTQSSKN